MKRSQALDVVRGVAILLVFIWHYLPRTEAVPGALLKITGLYWSGVDLFFVLSGYLIGSILLQNVDAGNYFKTFYIRRTARILPLYFLVVLAFSLILNYGPPALDYSLKNPLPLRSYWTLTQNLVAADRGTFGTRWMSVTWSLAVEEQFYLFLSLIVRNTSKRGLTILSIALIFLAPFLRYFAPNIVAAYVLPVHRADSLMLGVLFALIWQWDTGKQFLFRHANALRWSLLVFLAGATALSYAKITLGDPFGHFWLALCYGNILLLALVTDGTRWTIFKSRILEWFGLRSYGIYLLHLPFKIASPYITRLVLGPRQSPWIVALVAIVLTLVAAEISYRILERPIMTWAQRFRYEKSGSALPVTTTENPEPT